jgi:hypothetical protein
VKECPRRVLLFHRFPVYPIPGFPRVISRVFYRTELLIFCPSIRVFNHVNKFNLAKTLTCPSAKQSTTVVGKNLLPTTKFYPMPNFPSAKSGWGKLGDTFG